MRHNRGFLLALVGTLLVLSAMIVEPFLQYVLGAILLAYVLYPAQVRLEAYVSPAVAAFSLVVLAVAGFIVPFAIVLVTILDSADRILQNWDWESTELETIESRIEELTGIDVDLLDGILGAVGTNGGVVVERMTEVFGTITFHVLGVSLALFLLYYLLKDGDDLHGWLDRTIPLPEAQRRRLYDEIGGVMWGVIAGHVFVGIVQGLVAGVGLLVAGVPNPIFWTAVMVVLAMVPIVGTIPVWGGAVVYLYLTGEPVFAVGLLVYSVVVVGLTDDYLRPFAVDRYAKLNPAVILLGVLGGGYAFGVMGLFYGPVVLGALKASLNVLSDDLDRVESSEAG